MLEGVEDPSWCTRYELQRHQSHLFRQKAQQGSAKASKSTKPIVPITTCPTYMTCSLQRSMKLSTHLPHPVWIQLQQHAEQLRFLGTNPSIPMTDIRLIIDIGGIATVLPSLVLFPDRSHVAIAVDIVRENQMPGSRVVSKVGCRLGGDRANVQAFGSNFQGLVGCGCCTV